MPSAPRLGPWPQQAQATSAGHASCRPLQPSHCRPSTPGIIFRPSLPSQRGGCAQGAQAPPCLGNQASVRESRARGVGHRPTQATRRRLGRFGQGSELALPGQPGPEALAREFLVERSDTDQSVQSQVIVIAYSSCRPLPGPREGGRQYTFLSRIYFLYVSGGSYGPGPALPP